ncbi:zinc finger, CCHC-type containing protein [Tanacetum coccineum]|uniref:Zinc finger, CCHC-type containing protein n=1 Tax=Tanacetum coccineum TaxID=301880 RepID=A0ABQ5D5P4_9ASTR
MWSSYGGFTRGYGSSKKTELNKKAHSAVILCLGNKVLREVTRKTTVAGVWSKLKTLYMTKSLDNKLYLKKKLYTFYMPAGRKIFEHIDEFNKIVLDLANIEVKFKDEDLALLLLTSTASYKHFVDTLLYEREYLTLEDVMATLNSKEIKERSKVKGDDGKRLYVRGRTDRRDSRQSKGKSKSKSRGGRLKCYICQSEDHLKRNCLKNNRKKSTGYVKKDEQPSSNGSTYDYSEVMIVMRAQALLNWIVDSGCSYHMTPRLDILFDFLECDGGSVQLATGSVRSKSGKVKVINGSRVVLFGIRRDNCVYSLDGYAMAGELNASVEEKDSLAQVWHKRLGHISEARLQVLEKQFGKKSLGGYGFISSGSNTKHLKSSKSRSTIEKKTPMETWSGHPSDYGMLRIFGCATYPHDKQGKLELRAIKCVLLGYPGGVKGYRLYRLDDESPKIITSRNVVFNESVMYKDTLKDSGVGADKSVEELQGIKKLIRLPDLIDYYLAQDREQRTRMKPLRFQNESNVAAYAFVAAERDGFSKEEQDLGVSRSSSWAKAGELQMAVQDKERD